MNVINRIDRAIEQADELINRLKEVKEAIVSAAEEAKAAAKEKK